MFDNKQGTLATLPVAIRDFYVEEVRREATGNLIPKEPEGLEMEYTDVTYTVYTGSYARHNLVPAMVNGATLEAVDKHYERYVANTEWFFHSEYITWLSEEPTLVRARNDQGHFVADDETTEDNEAYENYPEFEAWLDKEPVLEVKALEDFSECRRWRQLIGIEFADVMCSATKEDMWGLKSVEDFVRAGNDTLFDFDNGNQLLLTARNMDAFYIVWSKFRASFFQ